MAVWRLGAVVLMRVGWVLAMVTGSPSWNCHFDNPGSNWVRLNSTPLRFMCSPSDSPAIRLFSGEEKVCSKQNKFPACFFQGMIRRIVVSGCRVRARVLNPAIMLGQFASCRLFLRQPLFHVRGSAKLSGFYDGFTSHRSGRQLFCLCQSLCCPGSPIVLIRIAARRFGHGIVLALALS